jgi:hypothetical protein
VPPPPPPSGTESPKQRAAKKQAVASVLARPKINTLEKLDDLSYCDEGMDEGLVCQARRNASRCPTGEPAKCKTVRYGRKIGA